MSDRAKSKDLLDRLRRHYIKPGPMPGGLFVPECGRNGSWGSSSRVDALYVGFTSASGRILVGHELKVSRADWRRELDKPGKADDWHDQCHAWYLVAPSTDIIPVEEVPEGWGLMVINPRTTTRLDVKVKARVRQDHDPSWDAVRSIMARQDTLCREQVHEVRKTARDEAYADLEERRKALAASQEQLSPEQRRRLAALDKLEQRIGVKLDQFDLFDSDDSTSPEVLGAALNLVRAQRNISRSHEQWMSRQLRKAATDVIEHLDQYDNARRDFLSAAKAEESPA